MLSEDMLMRVMLLVQGTFLRHCWHLLSTMQRYQVQFDKSLFKVNGDCIQNISYYRSLEFTEAGIKVWRYYGIGTGILVPYSIKWSFRSGLMIIKPFKDCLQISSRPSQKKNLEPAGSYVHYFFGKKGDVPEHLNY